MTTEAYLQRWATTAIPAGYFLCEMCGGVFPASDDDEARAEAASKGVDPDESGLVCDDCYATTPRGRFDSRPPGPSSCETIFTPADRLSSRPLGEFVALARRREGDGWATVKKY